ncbi:unnamed protein product [Anisakis simplex]|uniref:Secreted protein n=1 Tax=Anisakis simplex TaxID=6269 RepID=A0A0M3J341_ANISI|nr:unnamed protein product [Anisakis simplex]
MWLFLVLGCALWLTSMVLASVLATEVFRLLTELAKQKKEEQEQLPVLLADLDTLGQDTVYRQTITGTTEDFTKETQADKNKKKRFYRFCICSFQMGISEVFRTDAKC